MNWGAAARHQQLWDLRAAGNFIGGGTGCGLLFWATLGLIAGLPYFHAALIALAFVASGLFLVWLETGKPWRAINVLFRPQTSWMTREAIVGLPLFAFGTAAVLFDLHIDLWGVAPSPLAPAVIAAILGLLFLYCQMRILHSARGVPAWREPSAMRLLGVSGLVEGLGMYLCVTAFQGRVSIILAGIALALLAERAIAWHVYTTSLNRSATPKTTLTALLDYRLPFLILGHALPALLLVTAILWPTILNLFSALAGVAVALSGWRLKVVLVTKAAYMKEFTIPKVPVRGHPGLLNGTTNRNPSRESLVTTEN